MVSETGLAWSWGWGHEDDSVKVKQRELAEVILLPESMIQKKKKGKETSHSMRH